MYEKDPKKNDQSIRSESESGQDPGTDFGPAAPPSGPAAPPPPPAENPLPGGPPPPPALPADAVAQASEKKVIAGVLALILGGLGIHKFYLGYTNEGIIMLLVTVVGGGFGSALTCGLLAPLVMVMPIFGLIEGIMYLTKSDEDFAATYIVGRKAWF